MPERHAPAALRLEALSPLSFSLQLEFRVLKGISFGVLILGFVKQEVEKAKAKDSDKDAKQKDKDTWDEENFGALKLRVGGTWRGGGRGEAWQWSFGGGAPRFSAWKNKPEALLGWSRVQSLGVWN